MSFKKLDYNRKIINRNKDFIRARFAKVKGYITLQVILGSSICERLKITNGSKVSVYVNEENPREILIKKEKGSQYTVSSTSFLNTEDSNKRVQFTWYATNQTHPSDFKTERTAFSFEQDGVLIYLDTKLCKKGDQK